MSKLYKTKYLNKFFFTKYKFYKEKDYINKILYVDRERINVAVHNSILALALSKKYKSSVIILSDQKKKSKIIKVYKKLGFKYIYNTLSFDFNFFNLILILNTLIISTFGILSVITKGFYWFINNYKIKNIPMGDLIYDTNIRFDNRYYKPKVDFLFVKLLLKSTYRTLKIIKYFKKYKFKYLVIGTESYAFNSGIALRIALYKNVKNFSFHGGNYTDKTLADLQVLTFNKKDFIYGNSAVKKNNLKFKKFSQLKASQNKINLFYHNRTKLKTIDLIKDNISKNINYDYAAHDDLNKANTSSEKGKKFCKYLKSFKKRKKFLFAVHALSDAVHINAGTKFLFNDYYDQLVKTLKFIKYNNTKDLWIFRAHPNSAILHEKEIIKKTVKEFKIRNVLFCPENVPINELIEICESTVTGNGTIALEFACKGKMSLIAGPAPYSGFELVKEPKNLREYFHYLKNLNTLPRLKKNKIFLAKKLLFFFGTRSYISKYVPSELISKDKMLGNLIRKCTGIKNDDIFKLYYKSLPLNLNKNKDFKKILNIL